MAKDVLIVEEMVIMKNKTRDAAYKKYKQMKAREQAEKEKKRKKSIYYNPLEGGPLSESKDPLADVKRNKL